jgi:energy-coupling factor transporter ATP-binding protein EcfA2
VTQSDEFSPLSIQNLTFQYRTREQPEIEDVSFTLHAGELLLVAGATAIF